MPLAEGVDSHARCRPPSTRRSYPLVIALMFLAPYPDAEVIDESLVLLQLSDSCLQGCEARVALQAGVQDPRVGLIALLAIAHLIAQSLDQRALGVVQQTVVRG